MKEERRLQLDYESRLQEKDRVLRELLEADTMLQREVDRLMGKDLPPITAAEEPVHFTEESGKPVEDDDVETDTPPPPVLETTSVKPSRKRRV